MGSIKTNVSYRSLRVIQKNDTNSIVNGIYFLNNNLINGKKWYVKNNNPIAGEWAIAWDNQKWVLYSIGTIAVEEQNFPTENPWESEWQSFFIRGISAFDNKILIDSTINDVFVLFDDPLNQSSVGGIYKQRLNVTTGRKVLINGKPTYFRSSSLSGGGLDCAIQFGNTTTINPPPLKWGIYINFTQQQIFSTEIVGNTPWESKWEPGVNVSRISLAPGGNFKIRKNLFKCPFNINPLTCPSGGPQGPGNSSLSSPGWQTGANASLVGNIRAPDGSNNAVEYQSNNASFCFVSQGYGPYWLQNTKYTISIWMKLTSGNLTGGTIINATRNAGEDRVFLNAVGNLTSEWKKFTLSFTTGNSPFSNVNPYVTVFFFEGFPQGTRAALWGAEMYIDH